MTKKTIIIAAVLGIIFGIALFSCDVKASKQRELTKEEIVKLNKEILAKAGIEIPKYDEINIIPASTYLNKTNKDDNDSHIANKIQEYLTMHDEQQNNGYVDDDEPRASELIDIKDSVAYYMKDFNYDYGPDNPYMRDLIDDIKLAYTFIGVPGDSIDESIGYAPYGSYKSIKNGDDGDGWDGVVQFFENKKIGICAFTEHNRRLAHVGVELIKELVSYEVQNNPTVLLVKGNKENGYLYKIKWYGLVFNRELECANIEFSPLIKEEVIELANHIELHQ